MAVFVEAASSVQTVVVTAAVAEVVVAAAVVVVVALAVLAASVNCIFRVGLEDGVTSKSFVATLSDGLELNDVVMEAIRIGAGMTWG